MSNLKKNERTRGFYLAIVCLIWSLNAYSRCPAASIDTLASIHLQEIIIYATQPDEPGTRSVIGQDAIRHIQATDLSGLSQLLPGVCVRNPNLNVPAIFTIRSVPYDNTANALGTTILVDGTPLSNNTNMQQIAFGNYGNLYNSQALSGPDVRSIAPASIETVEVIRGIPSARYGDLTSGAVVIRSKAGRQPLTLGLRFTATEKIVTLGKGISIGKNSGALYFGADYAYSQQSPAIKEEAFRRISIQAAYTKNYPSAALHVRFRGYYLSDNDKKGKNAIEGEYWKHRDQGFSFSADGRWMPEKTWLTTIEYRAGLTFGEQKNESRAYYSGTRQVTTFTTQAGEHEGIFLSPRYFSRLIVTGKPVQLDASWIAGLKKQIRKNLFSHLQLGIDARMEGNRGDGIRFDPLRPPSEMLQVRTRSYREIPFLYQYGGFAENLISFHAGEMKTELQAGVRITGSATRSLRSGPAADPRINLRQVLSGPGNRSVINRLSIRVGWGLLHKLPVLAYLYPDKSYTDKNCFTYDDTENKHRLAVIRTFVTDRTFNPRLRLPVNRKFEAGVNFHIRQIETDIVWFDEHLKNGYCTADQAEPFSYRQYDPLINKGETPVLTDRGIVNDKKPLPYSTHTTFAVYARPENGIEQKKQGVEYTVGPIRWKQLRSSLLIDGSYIKTDEKNTALSCAHPAVETYGRAYPYAGVYETVASLYNRLTHQLFSTRFQLITQLPRIGLVTSLTLQCVWIDKQQKRMESRYGNPVYLTGDDGRRIKGDPTTDTEHSKCLNPVYYIDGEGNRHPFTQAMETDERFAGLVLKANTPTAFRPDSFGPYFLLNLRITKKLGRHLSVAFCANNLTKSNPRRYSASSRQYTLLNPDLYYGAEINVLF